MIYLIMKNLIYDYGMNGEGVTKVDNIVTLVPFALKDEEIDLDIIKSYGNYNLAKLTKINKKSKSRATPPCPYFYKCGGCDLQHMTYEEQLNFKSLLVKKTIKKICGIDVEVNPTIACDKQFAYRNKVSFNFHNSTSGFFEENSKNIVEVDKCLLISENMNKIYEMFKNFIKNNEKIANYVKNLVIREISNQILVGIVASSDIDLSIFCVQLCEQFNNIGVYKIINNRKDSVILSGKCFHICGIKEINISNFGINYSVDLLGFHQTNLDIQNKLYNKVLDFISTSDNVINGFSGQGLLTAILSSKAKNVIGIEINKSSHLSAEKLKKENKIKNMKNVLGDFNKFVVPYLKSADVLILDPSKKGCGKQVLQNIKEIETIIYISCNPIALSKDLNILKEHYTIDEITPFDMFPNTKNVETLVKLSLKNKFNK